MSETEIFYFNMKHGALENLLDLINRNRNEKEIVINYCWGIEQFM